MVGNPKNAIDFKLLESFVRGLFLNRSDDLKDTCVPKANRFVVDSCYKATLIEISDGVAALIVEALWTVGEGRVATCWRLEEKTSQ